EDVRPVVCAGCAGESRGLAAREWARSGGGTLSDGRRRIRRRAADWAVTGLRCRNRRGANGVLWGLHNDAAPDAVRAGHERRKSHGNGRSGRQARVLAVARSQERRAADVQVEVEPARDSFVDIPRTEARAARVPRSTTV